MKRTLAIFLGCLLSSLYLSATTLYLNPSIWNTDGAKYAVWYWTGSGDGAWTPFMTLVDGQTALYQTDVPSGDHVIFVRLEGTTATPAWGTSVWNQTADLDYSSSNNLYTISDWGTLGSTSPGGWSTYTPGGVVTPPVSTSNAVPAQCGDVMLQAFYWDSYQAGAYGDTRWNTLNTQSSEIASYFDLVWLAPSAKSSGGLGYHPTQWSNQSSSMGSTSELKNLITNLHQNDCKVVADIVVNHRGNRSTWCDFYADDFGELGQFQFTAEHIVGNDEVNSSSEAGSCRGAATGANDTGEQYAAARDLDHTNPYVRNAVKAYLKWLKAEMGYDAFRYDVAKGFSAQYFNEYNTAAEPYLSVGEYYDGNTSALTSWINGTSKNSMAFDFATKFAAFNQGIGSGNYAALQGSGLLGAGYSKYAVTFIDNHDTFNRSDNNNEFLGRGNSMTAANKEKVLHANAFMLSMPGVPCVFYPHWHAYKNELKAMILARKAAGIHSESTVTNESTSANKYECTVNGTNGTLILKIGSGSSYNTTPTGYVKMASGSNYGIFVKATNLPTPTLSVSPVGGKYIGGTSVTMEATYGGTIHYTLDGTEPTAASTVYSAPIAITTNNTVLKAFATNASGNSAVQTHTYTTENEILEHPITIKFRKPDAWTAVYIWAWNSENPVNIWGGATACPWPGKAATDNGDGWWSYTFDTSISMVNVIFSNGQATGGIQTGDIEDITEDRCYLFGGDKEAAVLDATCSGTGLSRPQADMWQIYPNPTENELHLQGTAQVQQAQVFDLTGRCVMQHNRLDNSTLHVGNLASGLYLLRIMAADGTTQQNHFIKK